MGDKAALEEIERVCREILAPLVRSDGGVFYLVHCAEDDVHIHLAGACAGCPGSSFTRERVVEPLIASVSPKTKVKLTTGWRVPAGARKLEA